MKTVARLFIVYCLTSCAIRSEPAPIPYVPTRHDTVRDLLWLADVGTNDVVYDLGSGDGRVVMAAVRDFGARRAVGIEINSQLVRESQEKATQLGLSSRVQFIQGDLFTSDFSPASVVVLYLGHNANADLRARLFRALKPGARVVSHQFGMGEWPPDKTLDVRTPFFGMYSQQYNEFNANTDVPDVGVMGSGPDHDVLSEWIIPAPVAGVWRGEVSMESGAQELKVTMHQRLSKLEGDFQLTGASKAEGHIQADLWGNHVRIYCIPTNASYGQTLIWFDGHADNEAMKGTLWVSEKRTTRRVEWVGRREKVDFTGTWEWAGASNSPVQLKIERHDQRLTASYRDQSRARPPWDTGNQTVVIKDVYDFGGGFYFTFLLGLMPDGSRRGGSNDGWLIGEAVAEDNTLHGTIAFYPYHDRFGSPFSGRHVEQDAKPPPGEGRRAWQPRRIAP